MTKQENLSQINPAGRMNLWALAVVLAGLSVAVGLAIIDDGWYQDDDVCHYLFAREAWTNPQAMWDVWARPGYNFPTMLVVPWFGMFGCRILSALQTAATAYLAYLIARRLMGGGGRRWFALLAPAFVWAQPMVMTLAHTTLTETPAMLYMTLAVWLYLRGNRVMACGAWSVMFVTRHETPALALIIACAVGYDAWRQAGGRIGRVLRMPWVYGCAAMLAWAPIAWALGAILAQLPPETSPLSIFSREHTAEYGSGQWWQFMMNWVVASGAGLVAMAAVGAVKLGRRAWLVTAMIVGLIVLESVLFALGAFASGGYPRFLVPVGGLVAVLAAGGVRALWSAQRRAGLVVLLALLGVWALSYAGASLYRRELADLQKEGLISLLAFAGICIIIAAGIVRLLAGRSLTCRLAVVVALVLQVAQVQETVGPLTIENSDLTYAIFQTNEALQNTQYRGKDIITNHVIVSYLNEGSSRAYDAMSAEELWRQADPGTLFFWDSKYGCHYDNRTEGTAGSRLYMELKRLGSSVCYYTKGVTRAEVFVRGPKLVTH